MSNKMKFNKIILPSLILIILIGLGYYFFTTYNQPEKVEQTTDINPLLNTDTKKQLTPTWQNIIAEDIANVHSAYIFSAQIPTDWQVEAVPDIQAINIFNPNSSEQNNLEKSQIFIRYFEANTFLTLGTVTIHSKTETKINERPAIIYDIEKKSSVANFPNQPLWRNQRHIVTDVRVSDTNPSTFYVIAKHPDLSQEIYDQFLDSLNVNNQQSALIPPVENFKERITKKLFGTYITPETSPIQPERFQGYHTGVDVEYSDIAKEVPVVAITEGNVVYSDHVSGYGGVIIINHLINSKNYLVLYGHLDPDSLLEKNKVIKAGQQIGALGRGETAQTDGERKHLHLAFYTDTDLNLKGYVETEEELKKWINPITLFP